MNMECLNVSGGIGRRIVAVLFLFSFAVSELRAASITLLFDDKSPQAVFASKDVQTALRVKGHSVRQSRLTQLDQVTDGMRIVLLLRSDADVTRRMLSERASPPGTLRSEGYSIRTSTKAGRTTYWIIGADTAGIMYGGLEPAEVIRLDDLERRLEVKTSPLVEVTHRTSRDGTFEWVGLFNHSGQLNNALHAPIPVDDIRISITPVKPIKAVRLLTNGRKVRVSNRKDCISMTVPTLKHYEIVLLEYE